MSTGLAINSDLALSAPRSSFHLIVLLLRHNYFCVDSSIWNMRDIILLFGRSSMIVGHHRLTDELFPAAAIFCSP